MGKRGGVNGAHGVIDGVPLGAEARRAVAAQVDNIDARDARTVNEDVVVGNGSALGIDEVAACRAFPHQVNKASGILR